MMIHEITATTGKYKTRKRVGRGIGSGHGKTCGKGHKGHSSRSGYSAKTAFEGGQMPFFRRMAKLGFSNWAFTTNFRIVNIGSIVAHKDFAKGGTINAESLVKAGLVPDGKDPIKILGGLDEGQSVKAAYKVEVERVTDSARKLIQDAGGSVHELGTRRDRVRGVDRNSDDRSPKNLRKKPKRRAGKDFSHLPVGSQKKAASAE
jgi:large subunit ribosomal protein L15